MRQIGLVQTQMGNLGLHIPATPSGRFTRAGPLSRRERVSRGAPITLFFAAFLFALQFAAAMRASAASESNESAAAAITALRKLFQAPAADPWRVQIPGAERAVALAAPLPPLDEIRFELRVVAEAGDYRRLRPIR